MNALPKYSYLVIFFVGTLLFASCEKKETSDHAQTDKQAPEDAPSQTGKTTTEATESSYEPGKGLLLLEDTKKNLGLEFSPVREQSLVPTIALTAQVYRSAAETQLQQSEEKHGFAYATVMVTVELGKKLKPGQKLEFVTKRNPAQRHTGVVWKVSNDMASLQKTEILLELPDSDGSLQVGDFISAAISNDSNPRRGLTVPVSAVLQASHGASVFLQNGNFLLRVPVKTGAQNDDFVEITEGLQAENVVLSKPVEAVYLIELRFVKGGAQAD